MIDITHYGEVVARLIPASSPTTKADEIATLLAEMDRLAEEVTAEWTGTRSAVDAVRESKREL